MHHKKNYTFLGLFAALILVIFFALYFRFQYCPLAKNIQKKASLVFASEENPFAKGEKIIYNVNLFGVKIGESQLLFLGEKPLNDKKAQLIIFTTNVTNLKDEEKIYVDSKSFLPLRVERNVAFLRRKMSIIEDYNLKDNLLTITKTESGKTTTQTIKSEKPMQNIISLVFLFRKAKSFDTDQTIPVVLPLLNFEMKPTKLVNFNTANNKYKAYLFESNPKKYRVWIDEGPKKIPLRLDGAVAFGNTAMVMRAYISGEK